MTAPDILLDERRARPSRAEALAARGVLGALRRTRLGALELRLPGGEVERFGEASAAPATLRVHDWGLFTAAALGGDVGVGESYMNGDWSTDDLPGLVRFFIRNAGELDRVTPLSWLSVLGNRVLHARRDNRRARAQRNIRAHYDLGNDFYALFLDPTMTYSCAIFTPAAADTEALETAQRRKQERLAAGLALRPGDRLLEIGCGWGSFAVRAAAEWGCRVTGITLSERQAEWARQQVQQAGLGEQVSIEVCDYRDVEGRFDKILSVEMLEAVGHRHFDAFFGTLDRLLVPGGRAAIQTITLPDQRYAAYRKRPDWIQKYIFPGGHLPSLGAITASLGRVTRLVIEHVEDIGPHYATTLRRWRQAFHANLGAVRAQGFDERFVRMWDYYLGYCEAAFAERATQDLQISLVKPG